MTTRKRNYENWYFIANIDKTTVNDPSRSGYNKYRYDHKNSVDFVWPCTSCKPTIDHNFFHDLHMINWFQLFFCDQDADYMYISDIAELVHCEK